METFADEVQFEETQVVPHSRPCEEAVLGGVIINPEMFTTIDLAPEDFYIQRNQWVWEAFTRLHERHIPIDFLTVTEELDRQNRLSEIGGPAYLTGLINQVPITSNAEYYAETIRDRARRRRLLLEANALARAAFNLKEDLDKAIAGVATNIVMNANGQDGAVHISHFAEQVYDEIVERSKNPQAVYGIGTGILDFDKITGGLQPGEVTLVSGESGLGKTIFITDLACGAADHAPGAFYEMEMKAKAVVRRSMSAEAYYTARSANTTTDLTVTAMKSGNIREHDWSLLTQAFERIAQKNIHMCDRSDWTTTSLRADLARLKARYGIRWFILDYMDLLRDNVYKDYHLNSAAISRNLHSICTDMDLAGVIIHTENKNKQLSGSEKVKYDADQIIVLEQNDDKRLVSLFWRKFREGDRPNRTMDLVRVPGFPTFQAIAREDRQEAHEEPAPKPSRKREPAPSAADLEPDWNGNEDLEL